MLKRDCCESLFSHLIHNVKDFVHLLHETCNHRAVDESFTKIHLLCVFPLWKLNVFGFVDYRSVWHLLFLRKPALTWNVDRGISLFVFISLGLWTFCTARKFTYEITEHTLLSPFSYLCFRNVQYQKSETHRTHIVFLSCNSTLILTLSFTILHVLLVGAVTKID